MVRKRTLGQVFVIVSEGLQNWIFKGWLGLVGCRYLGLVVCGWLLLVGVGMVGVRRKGL